MIEDPCFKVSPQAIARGIEDLLDENERLNNIINELDKLIEQYSRNDYYYKYNGKYLKSEIINDLKELKENK